MQKTKKITISLKWERVLIIQIDKNTYVAKNITKAPGEFGEELKADLFKI